MISKTVHSQLVTKEETMVSSGYPKILFTTDGKRHVATTQGEFLAIEADSEDAVIEAIASPSVTVASVEYPLVLGRDFDRCVLVSRTTSYVLNRPIPAPVLSVEFTGGTIELIWTNTFDTKTKIYRTDSFVTGGMTPSKFTLIAEVDSPSIPQTTGYYADIAISIPFNKSVAYYIENNNGRSTTKIVSN